MVSELVWEFTIDGNVLSNEYFLENTKITLQRKSTDGNTAKLVVSKTLFEDYTITSGMEVIIKRGTVTADKFKFRGRIYEIKENNGGDIEITCYDHLYALKLLLFTKSYDKNIDPEAGVLSAIAQDIIEDGGFTASVVGSGTDITLDKFISQRQSRRNRLKALATVIDYVLYEDYDNDYIRFEPQGYSIYPTTLEVGVNVLNAPVWKTNITDMRNKIYVDGAYEEDTRIETFSGDASDTEFTLSNTAETLKVTVGGTLQVLGVEGSSSSYDYTHDKELKTITFESGSVPGVGVDNIEVTYTTLVPYTSVARDDASISTYGITQEESYTFEDIRTSEDADARLLAILERSKNGSMSATLVTDEYDIKPGQKISFVDTTNLSKNGDYYVDKVVIKYPNPVDEVTIGDGDYTVSDLLSSVNDRLQAVESRDDLSSEILRQILQVSTSIQVSSDYTVIDKLSIIGSDVLYWDSVTNGEWDNFDWADDSADTYDSDEEVIVQGNNTYREFVTDSDFVDSTSNVTVNTTSNQFEFLASGVLVLGPISKNAFMTYYTLLLGTLTGSLTYEVSNDDKVSWETVSALNVQYSFDTPGSGGVYIRLTESTGSSTATLAVTKSTGGKFVTPTVKLFVVNS